jgi:hypothetical protein
MRAVAYSAAGVLVLLTVAWRAEATFEKPRNCTAADTKRQAFITSGAFNNGGPGYVRACGPSRAVIVVGRRTYAVESGSCGRRGSARWVYFGLLSNAPAPPGRGFSFVLEPGDRPGRVRIIDSIVQVGGLDLVPRGTAFVGEGLTSARFNVVTEAPPHVRFSGYWRCARLS